MTQPAFSCDVIVAEYLKSLRDSFEVLSVDDKCVLLTPFTRPDGDFIEIEAEYLADGSISLSDMGESLAFLYLNGLTLGRNVIEDAKTICRNNGIEMSHSELATRVVDVKELGESLQRLLQSSLMVSDLVQRRRFSERNQFTDVLESFLVGNRTSYERDVMVQGETSEHLVRFQVDSERPVLIQPLIAANASTAWSWAERWAFRFGDIRERDPSSQAYAVLDDRGERARVWEERSIAALRSRAIVVRWSENELLSEALHAA